MLIKNKQTQTNINTFYCSTTTMLLVKLINALCPLDPTTKHNIQSMFKAIQNMYCLSIVAYATYAIYTAEVDIYLNAIQIIHWQCIFDFLLCSPDVALHHIFVLNLTTPILQIPGLANYTHEGVATILSTEISTIFLALRGFIPQTYKNLSIINNAVFVCIFAYTRLYNYATQLIYNEPLHNKLIMYLPRHNSFLIIGAIYGLFFLNIYWAAIILKTLVKQFKSQMPSFQQCESIIKYMFFTSPLASLVIYRPFANSIYFLDTIGQGMLAVSSYTYHNAVSQQLIDKNVLDNDLIWPYINDVLLIHIRCFFCVLTNTNLYIHLTNNLPKMHLQLCLVYFSLISHSASIYHFVKYAFTLKSENHSLTVNEDDAAKLVPLQFFQGSSILLDSLIIAFSTNSLKHRNNMLIITALIFINGKVSPFYHMNHLIFHALLLVQTIFLCQSNVVANDQILNYPI